MDSYYREKTVSWQPYLYNGNPYTWKDNLHIETGPCRFLSIFNLLSQATLERPKAMREDICSSFFIAWDHSNGWVQNCSICAGNSPVTGEFQRPVTRSFDVFFDLCLNTRLSKQSWGWWFEMPSRPLWRHRNVQCISNGVTAVLH